jgi:hypothetical protein
MAKFSLYINGKASLAATKLAEKNSLNHEVNSMVNKTNPRQSNNTHLQWLMKFTMSLGLMLGVSFVSGLEHRRQSVQSDLNPFSRAEYEQLEPGMSLTDVRSILDRGIEVRRSERTATFIWKNADGSKITAIFENDKLKSKEQLGLE